MFPLLEGHAVPHPEPGSLSTQISSRNFSFSAQTKQGIS